MSDTRQLGLSDAARSLGVPVGAIRRAIRSGDVPAPPQMSATATLPAEWLATAQALVEASPERLRRAPAQKVPPFARYKGTSAWRRYTRRVREYARFRAAEAR